MVAGDSPRSKSNPAQRDQGAAELVAQIGEDRPELSLIDRQRERLPGLGALGGWGGSDFHGLLVPAELWRNGRCDKRDSGHSVVADPLRGSEFTAALLAPRYKTTI